MNLARLLDESAARGDDEYLVAGGRRVTFAQNYAHAHALAAVLRSQYGVRRGDRVAILAANSTEWITVFWAVAALGGVTVAMNSRWAAPEVEHGLQLTEPAVVIADALRRTLLPAEGAGNRSGGAPGTGAVLAGGARVVAIEDVRDLAAAGAGGTVDSGLTAGEEDPATILFTSGTTGRAKGVVHPQRSLIATVDHQRASKDADPARRRYLLATPLFHVAALHNLSVPRLALGDTAVMSAGRFDITAVVELIERESVTHWSAVPTMASRLADLIDDELAAARKLTTLRTLSLITAPAALALQSRLRALLPDVRTRLAATYGLTETACPVTAATDEDLAEDPLCVGRPVPRMQVRIDGASGDGADDVGAAGDGSRVGRTAGDGSRVGRTDVGRTAGGGVGEILVRGPHLMSGYWHDDAATDAVFGDDGWLRTGDIGEFVDGRLRVHSRRTDLIIRGGENVYPAEVEAVVDAHPAVAECMVHGVEHAEWGQEVRAIVVPTDPEAPPTEEDLHGFAAGRLAAYKVPGRWEFRAEPLPRNASAKVMRGAVLSAVRSGTGRSS